MKLSLHPSVFILYSTVMLKGLLAGLWRGAPRFVRRAGVWLTQPRFAVTAGAIVRDERGRVLLLKHVLRKGSGWGIPGGFLKASEQPEDALRRELREEIGLELDSVELLFVRALRDVHQVEIIFRAEMKSEALERIEKSFEIDSAEWFETSALPESVSQSQRNLIDRALTR